MYRLGDEIVDIVHVKNVCPIEVGQLINLATFFFFRLATCSKLIRRLKRDPRL